MRKKKVGSLSIDLKKNEKYNTHTPIDQMREQLGDYESVLQSSVIDGKKEFYKDFYIVVRTKKERLMNNVLRNYFIRRSSCPTPEWDQVVYKYHRDSDYLEFIWVIPARDVCNFFIDNALECPDDQKELLGYIVDFKNGDLLKKSQVLNGENIN